MIGPTMTALRVKASKAGNGQCVFCGVKLKQGSGPPRMICRKLDCRRHYNRAYAKDNPATKPEPAIREVVGIVGHPEHKNRWVMVLSCGHGLTAWSKPKGEPKPRLCPACDAARKAKARAPYAAA